MTTINDTSKRSQSRFDWPLLVGVYALAILGILCICMATYDIDVSDGQPLLNKILNSRSSMWQSIFFLISPIIILVVMAIPTEFIRARVNLAYYIVLGLLMITLVAGEVSNNLKGWLDTGMGRSLQPCEFAKLSVMLLLAKQLSLKEQPIKNFKDFMKICLIMGIPVLVVLAQGETGTVIVIAFMFFAMLFFGGVDWRLLLGMLCVVALGIGLIVAYALMSETTDYRILRLLAFMDPQKYADSGGYQIIKSQNAIGAGQMHGIGTFLPGSWTTLGYVPEASTDSVFSVVGESFGFVGCMFVLAIYLFLVLRMLYLARFTNDKFGRLVIVGVMSMLFFHVFQNIAMGIGYMPITGIPLPFLSYGGSNFVTNIAAIALVLNITKGRTASSVITIQLPKINTKKV
ncbi:MAG: rod shape-determining protein RodA [Clostridia bacterium]|nr:rod shape-determining protein RodA [Clostridia bacterium]MBR6753473.1 rod shape-determining protein RodA [Clostridia bacterium]